MVGERSISDSPSVIDNLPLNSCLVFYLLYLPDNTIEMSQEPIRYSDLLFDDSEYLSDVLEDILCILLSNDEKRCSKAIDFMKEIEYPEYLSAACFIFKLYLTSYDIHLDDSQIMDMLVLLDDCGLSSSMTLDRDHYSSVSEKESYDGILKWLQERIEDGYLEATIMLGLMYE